MLSQMFKSPKICASPSSNAPPCTNIITGRPEGQYLVMIKTLIWLQSSFILTALGGLPTRSEHVEIQAVFGWRTSLKETFCAQPKNDHTRRFSTNPLTKGVTIARGPNFFVSLMPSHFSGGSGFWNTFGCWSAREPKPWIAVCLLAAWQRVFPEI